MSSNFPWGTIILGFLLSGLIIFIDIKVKNEVIRAVEAPHREITLALLFGNIFVNNFTELTKTRLVPVD